MSRENNFMRPLERFLASAILTSAVLSGCGESPPSVPYASYEDDYQSKMDFARLEHEYPLTPSDLEKITPSNLRAATQEQIDQIYARLTAGPIPDGPFEGDFFFPKDNSGKARISEIAGRGLKGKIIELTSAGLEFLGTTLWKGKVFYRDQRVLRNRIDNLRVLKLLIEVDMSDIQKLTVKGQDSWLLFPAKLYCGQSLLDGRRESIIIDYAFSDDIEGYQENPDFLASRRGFKVRDEIRMVRPGFYLGRAYLGRNFLLNFTLYNEDIVNKPTSGPLGDKQIKEDCWVGPQRIVAMSQ